MQMHPPRPSIVGMPPHSVRSSMSAMRHPLSRDATTIFNCCVRTFHLSVRRAEAGDNGDPAAARSVSPPNMTPRKSRNAQAVKNVMSLQNRRPLPRTGGLAGGSFPGGSSSVLEGTPDPVTSKPPSGPKILTPRKPLVSRQVIGSARPAPQGAMARAPAQLRVTRNAPKSSRNEGPNLRGRNRPAVKGPQKREAKKGKTDNLSRTFGEGPIEDGLSDSMVQQLLRVQRKEWDSVPYEPKYAPGSFAANELIHAGRELFRGEAPPVKIWGRLEKTLGIVGMHGAAAHLQVRRVPEQTWPDGWTRHDDRKGQVEETMSATKASTVETTTEATPGKTAEV